MLGGGSIAAFLRGILTSLLREPSKQRKAAGAVQTGCAAVTVVCQRVRADFAITQHIEPLKAMKEPGR